MSSLASSVARPGRDLVRQVLNVVLAVGQVVVTVLGYIVGSNSKFSSSTAATSPIVPADYTFIVWSLIYAGALVYAIYQALPRQREDELLRRIGFYTASAYLATIVWLIAAQTGVAWFTVVCLFWILASLLGAFLQIIQWRTAFTQAQRWLVILPISIYTAWATIASIANPASVAQESGVTSLLGLSATAWTLIMLLVGTGIAGFVTIRSRGNAGYALTFVWALIGIVVANVVRSSNPPVAILAGILAVVMVVLLSWARLTLRRQAAR
ncbi:hypothetical protein KDA_42690 [Dictyobacter alpinus]|uniref:Tryptophan-rich sensory protein n=1 Tax=Dictyobacter alpinus TaxID=2014873 RepID=A0A402BBQ8_9CHLR|nr:hypothetical protein [Dictyobacter alpinus]GCE28785.1 hypothetical protein KDA_42690 [Dictyobacter alpinus]